MKSIWKVLGGIAGVAAAAALVPYRIEGDEETGEIKIKALAWNASIRRNDTDARDCDLCCEDECCCEACCAEEPSEAPEEPAEAAIEVDLRTEPVEGETDPA